MIELELMSETLTYGSRKSEMEIKKAIELFNELEGILTELIKYEEK